MKTKRGTYGVLHENWQNQAETDGKLSCIETVMMTNTPRLSSWIKRNQVSVSTKCRTKSATKCALRALSTLRPALYRTLEPTLTWLRLIDPLRRNAKRPIKHVV